jgi:predicted nucleotidyltransferase
MEVQEVTARILGRGTDAMTRDSLHPVLRNRIENSAIPVF